MDDQQIELPRHIDDPLHLLFWSADEFAPVAIGLVFGMSTGQAGLCTLAGLATTYLYRRFRDGRPDGYLLHGLYWLGLIPSKSRTIPNPFSRIFIQ